MGLLTDKENEETISGVMNTHRVGQVLCFGVPKSARQNTRPDPRPRGYPPHARQSSGGPGSITNRSTRDQDALPSETAQSSTCPPIFCRAPMK